MLEENKKEGRLLYRDGTIYLGSLVNDKLEGEGELMYSRDQNKYKGPLLHFKGEFKNNKKVSGTLTYKDGSIYEGCLNNDKREGENGKLIVGNKVLEGSFSNDKMNGMFKVTEDGKEE